MTIAFCPNKHCVMHNPTPGAPRFYRLNGHHDTQVVGPVQRYRCNFCLSTFSDRTFDIDYWTHVAIDYAEVHARSSSGECVSAVARNLDCSWKSAQNRIDRASRNLLAMHQKLEGERPLTENIVADGFESFDRSQFFPNHITLVVGQETQQVYSVSHVSHSRKGSMTEAQKKKNAEIAKRWQYKRGSLRASFARAIQIIIFKWNTEIMPHLSFLTDMHPAYPGAIRSYPRLEEALEDGSFTHEQYSSELYRDLQNPLFAVNYIDREIRKDVAAHARESACFNRNVANGMNRLALYLVWHNYWKPYRLWLARMGHGFTHAEMAGIEHRAIEEAKAVVFKERAFLSKAMLQPWALDIWLRLLPTPLKTGAEYLPKHAGGAGKLH